MKKLRKVPTMMMTSNNLHIGLKTKYSIVDCKGILDSYLCRNIAGGNSVFKDMNKEENCNKLLKVKKDHIL